MKLFLIGFMGSGKSFIGEQLSDALRVGFIDLDSAIETQERMTITEIFATKGEDYFRIIEKNCLEELTLANKKFVMACGGGTSCFFNNMKFMNEQGNTVWLNISDETILSRLKKEKNHRPLLQHISSEMLPDFISKTKAQREPFYQKAKYIFTDSDCSVENIIAKVK